MVLSKVYGVKMQCPQANCHSNDLENFNTNKEFEYWQCKTCQFRFCVWAVIGTPVIKK